MVDGKLDAGDWFTAGVATILALLGGIFPRIFGKFKARKDEVDMKFKCHSDQLSEHDMQLAVLQTVKSNMEQQLDDIREATNQTNEKLDQLLIKLMNRRA